MGIEARIRPLHRGGDVEGFDFPRFVMGCAVCAFMAFFAYVMWTSGSQSFDGYDDAVCRMENVNIERERLDRFEMTAEYSYVIDGHKHKGMCLDRSADKTYIFDSLAYRLPLLEKYAPGTEHVCHVNKANRADAVLEIENPVETKQTGDLSGRIATTIFSLIVALFVSAGIFLVVSAFPQARKAVKPRLKNTLIGCFLAIFGLPFAVAGIATMSATLRDKDAAAHYVATPAAVLYSGVENHVSHGSRGRSRTTYCARVGYSYEVDGKKYENDRISGIETRTDNYEKHKREAESYKPGAAITVYVSPENPAKSVLKKGTPFEWWFFGFMALFAIVGIAVCGGGVFTAAKALRSGEKNDGVSFDAKPLRRSIRDVVFTGVFAIFWNFISWSAFIPLAFDGARIRLRPELFFVALFPIIGIAIVCVFVRKLLRFISASKLELSLTSAVWGPGADAFLDWSIANPEAIESLEITLILLRPEGRGRRCSSRVASRTSLCKFAAPSIPQTWRIAFRTPDESGQGVEWRIIAEIKSKGARRTHTLEYTLQG